MKQTTGIISSAPLETDPEEGEDGVADVEWRKVEITAVQHGARLDRALVEVAPEFSRNYLQQLMEAGYFRTARAFILQRERRRVERLAAGG